VKLAVVANFAYGAITSNPKLHVGGVERQVALLCRWFAKRGHDVSLITWDEGYEDGVVVDGVKLIKQCGHDAGIPGLRFFIPRWSSLVRALRKADADLYYQNCAEYVTGQVALWCKWNNRSFVYSVASEPDCDPALPQMSKLRDKLLYKYGLNHCTNIIVQNTKQKEMLKNGFGLPSNVLPMPCDGPDKINYRRPSPLNTVHANIIWVGRIASVKRPDRVFEIAKKLPWCKIVMAGGADKEHGYAKEIFDKALEYENITMVGSVSQEQLKSYYSSSSILCCTSEYEGLPNTFLEAWSYGLPVLSTVDPDDVISKNEVGVFCKNMDHMIECIEDLKNNNNRWNIYSDNARGYFEKHHSMDRAMNEFERIFTDTLS
jgi:glycosyltransferase involved in cell wall biosynthesis